MSKTINIKELLDENLNQYYTKTEINQLILNTKNTLATNLSLMGVLNVNSSMSMSVLLEKILDIEASVGGIDITTKLSCSLSDNEIFYGGSVTVTGVLEADKDDTSSTNVDLEGYLKGATINIYHDDTLVGTAITNQDGEYSFEYEDIVITGENNVYAIFEGTDNYETCTSSNVSLSVGHHISLSSSKSILSYSDNETATITATYTGSSGETIGLYMNGKLLDYMTDNNDGTYTYSYNSHNLGDLEFYATNGDLTSDSIIVEDCYDYDTMTSSTAKWTGNLQGATYSSNGCSVTRGNWTRRYLTPALSLPCSVEWEITSLSPVNTDAMYVPIVNHDSPSSNTNVMDMIFASNKATINGESFTMDATGRWRIELNDGIYSVYHNDTLVKSFTKIFPSNPTWAFTTGDSNPLRSFTFKNVKIKSLDNGLSATKTILSYADNDTTTITYTPPFDTQGASVKLYDDFEDTLIDEMTYDSTNGVYTYDLSSMGYGDRTLYCKLGNIVLDSIDIEDCTRYDDASSDKTSSYPSPICYRGSGSATLNYNSTNGYYGTISNSTEHLIYLSEITGKDNFTIEFDALLNANDGSYCGIAGICAYEDNNNYSRLSCHNKTIAQRVSINGTATESETNVSGISRGDLIHYKFTIANNQIIELVSKETTTIGTRTTSYTPTNATKFGLALVWSNTWTKDTFLKNIKIKPLSKINITSTNPTLSYTDNDSTDITAKLNIPNPTGRTVSMKAYKKSDDSLVDTLTVTDNNDGTYTGTYDSQGLGEVYIKVECMNLQETYELEDCDYYADSTKIGQWGTATSGSTTFRVSSYSIGLTNYSVEMKFNTINTQIMVGNQNNWVTGLAFGGTPCYLYSHSSSGGTVTDTISNPVASDVWRIEVEGTTIRLYRNNTLTLTKSDCKVDYPKNLRLYPYTTSSSVDYVKVKAL